MIRKSTFSRLVLAASVLIASPAFAYPLNPWGARIPDQTLAINPFLYVYPGPSVSATGYGGVGFAKRFDLYAGSTVYTDPVDQKIHLGAFELMPRVFATPELAFTPHLFWTPGGDFIPAPEIHVARNFGSFAITANTGWRPTIGTTKATKGVDAGQYFAMVSPEVYFNERASIFLEINPFVPLTAPEETSVTLAPGVWWALDSAQKHSFSTALQITTAAKTPVAISGGIWYATTIGFEP